MAKTEKQPGQDRGQATRADIVNVARRLFSEHGYRGTGLADIEATTGLTKGAFYHHFRSKEDLALAVLQAARADYAERLIAPTMEHDSALQRIMALLDGAVALNERPEWRNCQMLVTLGAEMTAGDGRLRDAVRDMQESFLQMWADLIAQAGEAGELDNTIEPETAAQWMVNTMIGSLLTRKLGAARVDHRKVVELMKRTLLRKPARTRTAGGAQKR